MPRFDEFLDTFSEQENRERYARHIKNNGYTKNEKALLLGKLGYSVEGTIGESQEERYDKEIFWSIKHLSS